MLTAVLNALATPVGVVLRSIHAVLSTVLPSSSGWAWGLSIVLLTVTVRLLLFPLFVKQIKSQRRMQQLQPMVKDLQKRHKGDRETLNRELMQLYRDNNANPISGCLPLLLQLPVFFALFTVVRDFGPDKPAKFGLTSELLAQGGSAKIFGAPIAAHFRMSTDQLTSLGASSPTTVRVVAAVMVVLMGATTFWTQRQMIARSGVTDPQQLMIQKLMLYVLPFSFAVSGTIFPIGVLLYWVTTNLWSMGQQHYVIARMPPPLAPGTAVAARPGGSKSGVDGKAARAGQAGPAQPGRDGDDVDGRGGEPPAQVPVEAAARPAAGGSLPSRAAAPRGRAAGARRNKNRRGGRR